MFLSTPPRHDSSSWVVCVCLERQQREKRRKANWNKEREKDGRERHRLAEGGESCAWPKKSRIERWSVRKRIWPFKRRKWTLPASEEASSFFLKNFDPQSVFSRNYAMIKSLMEQFHLSMWEPIAFFIINIHLISSHLVAWVHQPLSLLTGRHFVSAFLSLLSLLFLPFSSFFLSLFLSLTFSPVANRNSAAIRHNVSWLKWNRIELAFFHLYQHLFCRLCFCCYRKMTFHFPSCPYCPVFHLFFILKPSNFLVFSHSYKGSFYTDCNKYSSVEHVICHCNCWCEEGKFPVLL